MNNFDRLLTEDDLNDVNRAMRNLEKNNGVDYYVEDDEDDKLDVEDDDFENYDYDYAEGESEENGNYEYDYAYWKVSKEYICCVKVFI